MAIHRPFYHPPQAVEIRQPGVPWLLKHVSDSRARIKGIRVVLFENEPSREFVGVTSDAGRRLGPRCIYVDAHAVLTWGMMNEDEGNTRGRVIDHRSIWS